MEQILNNGLILPQSGYEITSKEEMSYEDGGNLNLYISCTAGGFLSGALCGVLSGFITGFLTVKFAKLSSAGGWIGILVGAAVGMAVGSFVSTLVNKLVYSSNGYARLRVLSIWFFGINYDYEIDIAEKIGSKIGGGFGGGLGGLLGCLSIPAAYAKGAALGAVS